MESASPEGEGCRPCCVPPTLMKRLRQTCHLMFLPTYQHRFTTRPSRSRTSQVLPSLTPLHMPLPTEVTQASRTRRLILITTTCITSPCPVCPECHCRPFVDLNFDFFCRFIVYGCCRFRGPTCALLHPSLTHTSCHAFLLLLIVTRYFFKFVDFHCVVQMTHASSPHCLTPSLQTHHAMSPSTSAVRRHHLPDTREAVDAPSLVPALSTVQVSHSPHHNQRSPVDSPRPQRASRQVRLQVKPRARIRLIRYLCRGQPL